MHIVNVTDSKTKVSYSYDMDKSISTADDGLAFYISQLSVVEAKIYEVKYRHIVYQELVPVDMSDPEWIDEVTYFAFDAVTVGKFVGANARDLPESDMTASKTTIPVFYGGNAYGYSLDELRKSQQLRMPVDTTKASMSFRGFQEHAQRVAFFGDSDVGITGLFNNANVQLDNSVVDWDTATGAEIHADMQNFLVKVWQNSAEVHIPNVLVLPSAKWSQISTQRMDSGTDTTVLQFFMKNNLYTDKTGQPITVKNNLELNTAGVASAPRMLAYELTAENLTMRMPMPWRSIAPQPIGLRIQVPAEYKFGGVAWRYPGSAGYRDFI